MGVIHLSYPYSRLCTRSILHSGGGERRQVHAVVDGLPLHLHKQGCHGDGEVRQHEQRERQSESDLFPRRRVDTPPLAGHGDATQHQQRGQDTAHALQQGPHGETVVLLSKLNAKQHIEVELNLDELDLTAAESKATYDEIKAYVLEKYGLKVSSLYISQIKRKCGLDVGQNYNLSKKEDAKVPQCPPEKEAAIIEALKHFQMI